MDEVNKIRDPGRVIKRIRKEKKMTQAQVCGDGIARNLLSQIESGKVNPSLKTLNYIADRLGVEVSVFFLTEEEMQALYVKEQADAVCDAYQSGDFARCLALCDQTIVDRHGIVSHYRAAACYALGYDEYLRLQWNAARSHFSIASAHGGVIGRCADQMLDRMSRMENGEEISPLDWGRPQKDENDLAYLSFVSRCITEEEARAALSLIEKMSFESDTYRYLALSMLYAITNNDTRCRSAQIMIKEKDLDPCAAMYYYKSAEECCARMNDFETAYKMAKKRSALEAKIQKK